MLANGWRSVPQRFDQPTRHLRHISAYSVVLCAVADEEMVGFVSYIKPGFSKRLLSDSFFRSSHIVVAGCAAFKKREFVRRRQTSAPTSGLKLAPPLTIVAGDGVDLTEGDHRRLIAVISEGAEL